MSLIKFGIADPQATGVDAPSVAYLVAALRNREAVDGTIRTTNSFRIDLVEGRATTPLSDTGPNQCWEIAERGAIAYPQTRYVIVNGDADYVDLVDVDPLTLIPLAVVPPSVAELLAQAEDILEEVSGSTTVVAESLAAIVQHRAAVEAVAVTSAGQVADVLADPASVASISLSTTIATKVTAQVPGEVSTSLANNATVQQGVNTAITNANVSGQVATAIAAQAGKVVTGSGSPQGAVTAGVGTFYSDTAATQGVRVWYKLTGSGNTGWQPLLADTAVRALSPVNLSSVGAFRLQRVGAVCEIVLTNGVLSTSGEVKINADAIPFGFRPGNSRAIIGRNANGNKISFGSLSYDGLLLTIVAATVGDVVSFSSSYVTPDAWPTTLPGTAA